MAWVFLLCAAACEMVWPLGFKYTEGFTKHTWAIGSTFGIMILSFWLMSQATNRGIPVGTAYAVWTGLGATGIAILGMIIFNEPRDVIRLCCLGLIIIGVIGVKFLAPPEQKPATTQTAGKAVPTQAMPTPPVVPTPSSAERQDKSST